MDLRNKLIEALEETIALQKQRIEQLEADLQAEKLKHISPTIFPSPSPQWPGLQPYGPVWTSNKPFDLGNITVSWNDEKEKQTQEGASS